MPTARTISFSRFIGNKYKEAKNILLTSHSSYMIIIISIARILRVQMPKTRNFVCVVYVLVSKYIYEGFPISFSRPEI